MEHSCVTSALCGYFQRCLLFPHRVNLLLKALAEDVELDRVSVCSVTGFAARDTPPAAPCASFTVTVLERHIPADASRGTRRSQRKLIVSQIISFMYSCQNTVSFSANMTKSYFYESYLLEL